MTDASTDDCKKFIQDHAASLGLPATGAWKRKSKTRESEGWLRFFEHASGSVVRIIEPFGQGAPGLRALAPDTAEPPLSPSGFDSASPSMQAAMLWRDAMRALGGKPALHTEGPRAHGWHWSDFFKNHHDHSGLGGRDQVQELTQEWVDLGMAEPAARSLLLDGVSWCFDSDAEYCDDQGYWNAGEGALVDVWPTDAPDEFGSDIANPVYSTDLDNSMESVFHAGASAASGREAFIRAWDEMKAFGCRFDMARQKEFNQNAEYDEAHPMDKKIKSIIPELIAAEDARKISKTASAPPNSAQRPPRSGL